MRSNVLPAVLQPLGSMPQTFPTRADSSYVGRTPPSAAGPLAGLFFQSVPKPTRGSACEPGGPPHQKVCGIDLWAHEFQLSQMGRREAGEPRQSANRLRQIHFLNRRPPAVPSQGIVSHIPTQISSSIEVSNLESVDYGQSSGDGSR
jgi:hypothetical protein